jgi:hypothetical protein
MYRDFRLFCLSIEEAARQSKGNESHQRQSQRADSFGVSSAACGDSSPRMDLELKLSSQEAQ